MRIDLNITEYDGFFRSTDNKIALCFGELYEWFDFPEDVKAITLALSKENTFDEETVSVYYYPSAHPSTYRKQRYDTYGLTKNGMFLCLGVLDHVVRHIVKQMDLPPQGILYVSSEYEE